MSEKSDVKLGVEQSALSRPRLLYDKILATVELKIRGVNGKKYRLQAPPTNPISRGGD